MRDLLKRKKIKESRKEGRKTKAKCKKDMTRN